MSEEKKNGSLGAAFKQAREAATSSFPLETLPPWLRAHVESVAHRLQVSADMPAAFSFAVLSAAVGRTARVRAWRGFEQPAVVWTVIAAASGENKSAVVNAMKAPIVAYQRDRKRIEQPTFDEAMRRYELLKKQAEAMATQAVRNKGQVSMEDAQTAAREAAEATPAPVFRLTFDSATTEALVKELAAHEFLAHLEGEGDVFTDIVGRYDSGGLLKQYLDAFDGEGIDLDRVKHGNVSAERVLLVLGVMIQPDMLARVMGEGSFKGRGLLERCLYAMPTSLVGKRDMRVLDGDREAEDAYAKQLLALCAEYHQPESELPGKPPRRPLLRLTRDAQAVFVAYRQRIETRLTADLASIVSWVNKAQGGMALRVAGLLAAAWDSGATEISAETMQHAVKVMEVFFIPQALRTFGDLRGDASGHLYRQLERWLRSQKAVFTARDLQKARGDLFKKADDAREALNVLAGDGIVEVVERHRTKSAGPKPQPGYRTIRQDRQVRSVHATPQNTETKGLSDAPADSSDLSDLSAVPAFIAEVAS